MQRRGLIEQGGCLFVAAGSQHRVRGFFARTREVDAAGGFAVDGYSIDERVGVAACKAIGSDRGRDRARRTARRGQFGHGAGDRSRRRVIAEIVRNAGERGTDEAVLHEAAQMLRRAPCPFECRPRARRVAGRTETLRGGPCQELNAKQVASVSKRVVGGIECGLTTS